MSLENVNGVPKERRPRAWYLEVLLRLGILIRLPFDWAEQFVESFDWWDHNPWHRLKLRNEYNVAISDPIPIQLIKDIKNFHKTGFTAVIHAAIAGGVRNTLIKHRQSVPRKIHLSAPFPQKNHPDKLRNHL
jgi:hypothetical protein